MTKRRSSRSAESCRPSPSISSAALRLLDGRVVSGDAAVSVLPSGKYVVRFQAPEHPAAISR